MESFKKLGICEPILKAIRDHKFEDPTTIQEKSIPPIIEGRDVMGKSATGSGKTLAFGAGIIQNLNKGEGVGAVILTPTRELCEQVNQALNDFSKYKPLNIISIYGGVAINPQITNLKKADVVVATPGRLLDHLERGTIDLSKLKTLVLDEADRMLDMGFVDDVNRILGECPKDRQTLLFSATFSSEIRKLADTYTHDPVSVSADEHVDPTKLTQEYYNVDQGIKFALLVHLLSKEHAGLVIIFCNTRREVDFISSNLNHNKIDAVAMHGGLSQARRIETLSKFQSDKLGILVCTDVAARGLDIPGVTHVYNYDLPNDSREYVHRIGRTARAGKDGKVVNILSSRDFDNFSNILNAYRDLNIVQLETPSVKRVQIKQVTQNKGFKGKGQDNKGSYNKKPMRKFNF